MRNFTSDLIRGLNEGIRKQEEELQKYVAEVMDYQDTQKAVEGELLDAEGKAKTKEGNLKKQMGELNGLANRYEGAMSEAEGEQARLLEKQELELKAQSTTSVQEWQAGAEKDVRRAEEAQEAALSATERKMQLAEEDEKGMTLQMAGRMRGLESQLAGEHQS